MKNLERTLKVLANKRRLEIIKYLKKNRFASVGDIAENISLSFRSTSKHLNMLHGADIVERDHQSTKMFYRISENQKPSAAHIISII